MTDASPEWLPALMTLNEHDGNWNRYIDHVYAAFTDDFLKAASPTFEGRRCGCKRYPLIRGKVATFWHLVSEGAEEDERLPDLRRCERIRWPRAIIERPPQGDVRVWRSVRGGDKRIVIAVHDFSYVVVLADRGEYVLIWTAYCVEKEHRRAKLRKECERSAEKGWGRP